MDELKPLTRERQTQMKSVICRIDDILQKDLANDMERFVVAAVVGITLQRRLREQGIGLLMGNLDEDTVAIAVQQQDASKAEQELAERFAKFIGKSGQA